MSQMFFEVFKELPLNKELTELMQQVEVTKISKTSTNDVYRFYIQSSRLISKENILKIEKAIDKKVFANSNTRARLVERYNLSKQYTTRKLWDIYFESLLLEYKHQDVIIYSMLKGAEYHFEDDEHLVITLAETIISETYSERVKNEIERMFLYRFGFELHIQYDFTTEFKFEHIEENKLKFENELKSISARARKNEEKEEKTKADGDSPAPDSLGNTTSVNAQGMEKESKPASGESAPSGNRGGFGEKKEFRKEFRREPKKSDNPDVIYGRDFDDETVKIETIQSEIGEVVIAGEVRNVDSREIRGEKTILMFDITDYSDTMGVKMFLKNEMLPQVTEHIKVGKFLKIKGIVINDRFDHELCLQSIVGIKKFADTRVAREDNSIKKRVELHCHTKMSEMDAVTDAGTLIKQAIKFGHRALAITDHGVVQGFTEGLHALQKIREDYKKKEKELDFKIIYGVEAYLVDDLKDIVVDAKDQDLNSTFVVFDIETTGFSAEADRIIEIGAVKVENGEIVDRYSTFINPEIPIPFRIEQLTHINDNMVINERTIDVVLPEFLEFVGDAVLVAHNAEFDTSFIKNKASKLGITVTNTIVDTVPLARTLIPNLNKYTLDAVAKAMNVKLESHHRAVDDAGCTADFFVKFIEMLRERGVVKIAEINKMEEMNPETIRKMPTHHAIIIATNEVGRVNLYRLISNSHLLYYNRRPRIPKSDYLKHKEGLIIGSACEAGELYQAILNGHSEADIARLVNFYDYLEIQPLGNNMFMIESDKAPVNSVEDLKEINRKIVKLGEKFNKPVVATCDVHFMNPEDEIYRRIIMSSKGFDDADNQAPLFLRTTEEMLAEFQYLGSDKAEEVVITNTNLICDLCEPIDPVSWDKCPPVIENSDNDLREICYRKAKEMYGEELPEIVVKRLDRELNSIISNGYSVMYIIAQKLVWKSNEDGYLVGSRGSVGSSFAATMAGITEVNPLSPHYLCPQCHYSEFDTPEVKAFAGGAGCDMPDKDCPVCGHKLNKEGFDIPFETFLGFKGNKEPDIDLNFSGEYQSKAHSYTEVIFGAGQTFKAGTIGTVADKTAYGYVAKYYEEHGIHKRPAEISRVAEGCTGIKRTTGQHPGGIVVLPHGYDINTFTPVQHPANDMTTNIVTTHFDYHSIDHNLLKLDILGHDDPTMIRMLQDLTGVDPKDIPLDSPEVMSLFQNTDALGITPEQIGGCKLGALGIPEFGTDFAMQMLIDTQPKHFSDLVRIAGLSHGTDVWLGNAQELIKSGQATISTAICTRDDIMTYLIGMGLDSEESFKIMEAVRKGTVAKKKCGNWEEWKKDMKEHNVPDWYIWSCEKIQYMFPKAHAAAYVMMAWRIAYCKVFYPLAYYASFFSIRAKAFSYEVMCLGKDKLEFFLDDFKSREDSLSNKESDMLRDMRIVQEMYARGFEFLPIDLFKADALRFQIIDGKLMPSLSSIDGLGENAAVAIADAAKNGAFLSKDDFRIRTKATSTQIELLDRLGILGNLPDSNQLSLFDMF
ncbi:MAG: PolC-type DNA polymerase III [Lachnospiraceae bacterium]